MPRPKKCRRICALPRCSSFGPLEGAADGRVEMACAAEMGVARSTVQQVYDTARRRLAQALVEGRRLHISGGDYVLCPRGEECPGRDCARRDCGMGRCGCGACLRSKEN